MRQIWVDTHTHTHTHTVTHTHTHTHIHTYIRTYTQDNYNESTEVQTLGVIRIYTYNYSINVLSKCSTIISHRPWIIEGRHIDRRSSTVDTSIIDLRRSTHRSPKVDTSIIDLQRSTHWSPMVDSSIFEDRGRKHRTDIATALHSISIDYYCYNTVQYPSDEVTAIRTACDPTRALVMYYTLIYIAYMC